MTNDIPNWSDSFGRQVAAGITNVGDLPADHTFTPSRYRLTRNTFDGNGYERVNYVYGEGTDILEDSRGGEEDVFVLTPNQGEAVQFKSAEQFPYVVGYDGLPTFAFALSRELVGDDRITLGLDTAYPPLAMQDGYFMEHNASHDSQEVDLFERRNGVEIGTRNTVSLKRALTVFQRFELQFNWYNVGAENWTETYTSEKDGQINQHIGTTQVSMEDVGDGAGPGGRGPISGTGRITFEVERDANSEPLEAWIGSMAFFTMGDDIASFEEKWARQQDLDVTQSGSYEPLMVIRKVSDDPGTEVQTSLVESTDGPGGEILAMSMDKRLVRDANGDPIPDADFSHPVQHGVAEASAVEVATTVEQFPDRDGNIVETADTVGGYQLLGSSDDRKTEEGTALRESRQLVDGDVCVILAKPEGTNSDFTIEYMVQESQ